MNYCKESPETFNFFINSTVHVFILLTIISAFFFLYVSQLGKNKFRTELKSIVQNNLTPAIIKADKDGYIKNLLLNMNLEEMKKYYSQDNESTILENNWLLGTTISIILILILLMIITIFIINYFCESIPFREIMWENVILFSLVACVEISFFLFIARKFSPTKPSLVMNTMVESLKNIFNN